MSLTALTIRDWLDTVPPTDYVAIDDGGLILQSVEHPGNYLEVGGIPDDEADCPQGGGAGVQNAGTELSTSGTGEPESIPHTVTLGPELRQRIADYRTERAAVARLMELAVAGEIEYRQADEAEYDVNETAAELLAAVLGEER